jgi:hypothetical protein
VSVDMSQTARKCNYHVTNYKTVPWVIIPLMIMEQMPQHAIRLRKRILPPFNRVIEHTDLKRYTAFHDWETNVPIHVAYCMYNFGPYY